MSSRAVLAAGLLLTAAPACATSYRGAYGFLGASTAAFCGSIAYLAFRPRKDGKPVSGLSAALGVPCVILAAFGGLIALLDPLGLPAGAIFGGVPGAILLAVFARRSAPPGAGAPEAEEPAPPAPAEPPRPMPEPAPWMGALFLIAAFAILFFVACH